MARLPRLVNVFWASDRGLTLLNLFLISLFFLVPRASERDFLGRFLLDIFFVLILLTGVAVVSGTRRPRLPFVLLALFQLVTQVLRHVPGGATLETLNLLSTMVFFGVLAALVLVQVFREGPINFHRIQGSIAVYLIVGFMWGFIYQAIDLNVPACFLVEGARSTGETPPATLFYFSFVTLTTVGFGDVTPLYPLARSLAMLEALIGQLFPAILIARLVAMSVESKR